MSATNEPHKSVEMAGACAGHDHDLVHELSNRLEFIGKHDQHVKNAEGNQELQSFWADLKTQELKTVGQLKGLIAHEIQRDCF